MSHVEVGGGRTGKPDITQAIGTEKHGYARIGIAISALKRRKLQVRQKQETICKNQYSTICFQKEKTPS